MILGQFLVILAFLHGSFRRFCIVCCFCLPFWVLLKYLLGNMFPGPLNMNDFPVFQAIF